MAKGVDLESKDRAIILRQDLTIGRQDYSSELREVQAAYIGFLEEAGVTEMFVVQQKFVVMNMLSLLKAVAL